MGRPTILVVDDDKGQQRRLATLLDNEGYQVLLADNGAQALTVARTTPPDLVFSDIMMPEMDGFEMAMEFKCSPELHQIPIVLHSNLFNDAKDRLLAEAIGVSALFDKTVPVDELLEGLRDISQTPRDAGAVPFDEMRFQRMRARLLLNKMELGRHELQQARLHADNTEQQLHSITDALPDLISEIDNNYRFRYANKAYEEWLGKSNGDLLNHTVEEVLGTEYFTKARPHLEQALRGEKVEWECRFHTEHKGSRTLWVRYIPHVDNGGNILGLHALGTDITERKAIEAQLQRSNRTYKMLLELNQLIANTEEESALLHGACQLIQQSGDYPLIWIGRVEHDVERSVIPVAQAGFEQGYLDNLQISWGDNELGLGATGCAIRTGKPHQAADILNDPDYTPWHEAARHYGFASSLALPINIDKQCVAALNIYACEPFAFTPADTELLTKVAEDIGFGLLTLRMKEERRQIEASLRNANRAYRTLVQLKKALTQQQSESALLHEACRILNDSGSYRFAWIGYAEHGQSQGIQPVASAGEFGDYLQGMRYSWGNSPTGRGPTGSAIREQRVVVINDIATIADFQLWSEAASEHGFRSVIAIPLASGAQQLGAITLYADVTNAFHSEEVTLLEEFASELAAGVLLLRQKGRYQQTEDELRYQRKLFEAVFRHIPDTMVITDTEQHVILCNSALIRDFKYFPEELFWQNPAMLYADKKEFDYQQQLRFNNDNADILTPYTIDYRRKDGTTFKGETLCAPFRDRDHNLLGYITVIRDISERFAMENERLQLQMQLQQAQKMETVGQLTGGIAHDFNNILAAILGHTELALMRLGSGEDTDSVRMRRYLNEVQGAGLRARDIIAKLLTFSRTNTSEPRLVELAPLLEESIGLLRPLLPASIELTLKIENALPHIEVDPNQLHQIVMNLCVNARDALEGRGHIVLEARTLPHHHAMCSSCGETIEGDYLRLSVSDNGSGIPEAVKQRMFDPFFTTKAIGKGTGLGLSMVHGIVHHHHGHIEVVTSEQGTTFHIYLPIAHSPSISAPLEPGNALPPPSIVVIDDDPMIVMFLEQLLRFNGYITHGFVDPQQALTALLQGSLSCDLVITDQVMPGITGKELAAQLKHTRPELPILLCSGVIDEVSAEEAEQCGIDAFLAKPLKSHELLPQVHRILSKAEESATPLPPDLKQINGSAAGA